MNIIEQMEQENMRHDMPDFRTGDTVKVHIRIIEGNKERTQLFQGVVIRRRRGTMGASVTVRKISHGVGVEKTFPVVLSQGRQDRTGERGPCPSFPPVLPAQPARQGSANQGKRHQLAFAYCPEQERPWCVPAPVFFSYCRHCWATGNRGPFIRGPFC